MMVDQNRSWHLVSALLLAFSCSSRETEIVTLGYDSAAILEGSRSALLGVIAPNPNGVIEILHSSGFVPPDEVELSDLPVSRVDAEVVILTYVENLAGAQPIFLFSSAPTDTNTVQVTPSKILHAGMQGASQLVELSESDPRASWIQSFADMVYVDAIHLLPPPVVVSTVSPTPTPAPTATPTATPTPTPSPTPTPTPACYGPPGNQPFPRCLLCTVEQCLEEPRPLTSCIGRVNPDWTGDTCNLLVPCGTYGTCGPVVP
jgi:hypothetical protein